MIAKNKHGEVIDVLNVDPEIPLDGKFSQKYKYEDRINKPKSVTVAVFNG